MGLIIGELATNLAADLVQPEVTRGLRRVIAPVIGRVRHGRRDFVLLGATGSGKSTLGRLLQGELPEQEYAESSTIERGRVSATPWCFVHAQAGQKRHKSDRGDKRLLAMVKKGRLVTVFHVVCYGYCALPYRADAAGLSEDLWEKRRSAEIHQLRSWIPWLSRASTRLRFVTVVTKSDIWWPERREVARYYQEQSLYVDTVRELEEECRRGGVAFSRDVWEVCLTVRNIHLWGHDPEGAAEIVKHDPVWDEVKRKRSVNRLLQSFSEEAKRDTRDT